jgi:hypothetical protein
MVRLTLIPSPAHKARRWPLPDASTDDGPPSAFGREEGLSSCPIARNQTELHPICNPAQCPRPNLQSRRMLDAHHPLTEDDMALRFIGTTSEEGDCPTLYDIPETDEILVQGDIETDPEHLVQLRDVKPSESFVRVPRSLLTRYAPRTAAPDLVPFSAVAHLFKEFRHTAWRLETRRGYASDRNSPKWARWTAGEDITAEPENAWRENVRTQTEQGKRFERVRLVDEPATQGQEFLLATGLGNVAAGEDIRNLTRTRAEELRLPEFDFWLFDSKTLVRFAFDEEDVTLGVYVTEEPADVLAACQARDAAWHHATRTQEFQRRVRSSM